MKIKRGNKSLRSVLMNSFDPTSLLMTTDEQISAVCKGVAAVATRQALSRLAEERLSKNINPGQTTPESLEKMDKTIAGMTEELLISGTETGRTSAR